MAIDPGLISGGIGLISSLFGGKKKAPRNPFLDSQRSALDAAQGIVRNTNLTDLDQKLLENYRNEINRQSERAISAQNASDFARNDQPLVDSERGVARGVIARSGAEAIANLSTQLDASRPDRGIGMWERIASMSGAGYGNQNTQNQMDMQAQASYDQGLAGIADLITRSMKPKVSGNATDNRRDTSSYFSSGNARTPNYGFDVANGQSAFDKYGSGIRLR
jgi:uncharacterized protein